MYVDVDHSREDRETIHASRTPSFQFALEKYNLEGALEGQVAQDDHKRNPSCSWWVLQAELPQEWTIQLLIELQNVAEASPFFV